MYTGIDILTLILFVLTLMAVVLTQIVIYLNFISLFFKMSGLFPPIIIEATVQELPDDMGQLYQCEAVGSPLPDFTWSAVNINTGSRELLENDIPGITINDEAELAEVNTELIISSDAEFRDPICVAENSLDEVMRGSFILETVTGKLIARKVPVLTQNLNLINAVKYLN